MRRIGRGMVKAMENTAPGACKKDRDDLYGKLQNGQILGAFNEQERIVIWNWIVSAIKDSLIPSFSTFFEDVNYLEGSGECLKRLVQRLRSVIIMSALLDAFTDVNQ